MRWAIKKSLILLVLELGYVRHLGNGKLKAMEEDAAATEVRLVVLVVEAAAAEIFQLLQSPLGKPSVMKLDKAVQALRTGPRIRALALIHVLEILRFLAVLAFMPLVH